MSINLETFTQGTKGTVTLNDNGTANNKTDDKLVYTPNANYFGSDSFTYSVSDGKGGTDTATVNVTVNPVNDAPDAVNDSAVTNEDTAVTIAVLANDIDIDGDGINLETFTQGTKGTVTLNDNGTANNKTDDKLVYTPNTNFNGNDSFIYEVSDGNGGSDTASVTIDVREGGQPNIINGTNDLDDLMGTEGKDIITGFLGADTLTGNGGSDTFVYQDFRDRIDTITDFATDDRIDLSQIFASKSYGSLTPYESYVKLVAVGGNTEVQINPMGDSRNLFRNLVTLEGVTATDLNANNFIC